RVYGSDGILIYQTNTLERSSKLRRLHPILDPLSFYQRKYIRACHHTYYLRRLRECLIQRGFEVLNVLKPYAITEPSSSMIALMNVAKSCTVIADSGNKSHEELEVSWCPTILQCLAAATPYEIVSSGVVPAMLNCLKRQQRYNLQNLCFQDYSPLPQLSALKSLTGTALHVFIRKIIETFEIFERYPVTSPNLTGPYEQLVQRSIQLKPKLQSNTETQALQIGGNYAYQRKIDLSRYRIYAAPLVTFDQLRNWIVEKINTAPWYTDALENMEFVHDLTQTSHGILLLPPSENAASPEVDASEVKACFDTSAYPGGLFHWISTNGGREPKNRINPTLIRNLLRITTSDAKMNNRPLHLSRLLFSTEEPLADRTDAISGSTITVSTCGLADDIVPLMNQPWIFIDTKVMLEVSHYGVKVPVSASVWPHLQHWQLLVRYFLYITKPSSCFNSWQLFAILRPHT
uniref:TENS3 n=1 Tax=Mesocestoides corti TaxID=53468 RepID=A0A5K3EG23_MESCO